MTEDAGKSETPTAPFRDSPRGETALLIIDLISELDFQGAEDMMAAIDATATATERLIEQARASDVAIIYVNDNFGEWHSERSRLVARALSNESRGRKIAERLQPGDADYFIIKPQFSGFYSTNLPVLLPKLGVSRLVLTGIAADVCVLFTAADAHMRDYKLWIPADAVAARTPEQQKWAIDTMRTNLHAEVRPTTELLLKDWAANATD